jgi:hypothetical protein
VRCRFAKMNVHLLGPAPRRAILRKNRRGTRAKITSSPTRNGVATGLWPVKASKQGSQSRGYDSLRRRLKPCLVFRFLVVIDEAKAPANER